MYPSFSFVTKTSISRSSFLYFAVTIGCIMLYSVLLDVQIDLYFPFENIYIDLLVLREITLFLCYSFRNKEGGLKQIWLSDDSSSIHTGIIEVHSILET